MYVGITSRILLNNEPRIEHRPYVRFHRREGTMGNAFSMSHTHSVSHSGTHTHIVDPRVWNDLSNAATMLLPGLNHVGRDVGLHAGEEAVARTFQCGLLGSIMLAVGAWRGFIEYEANGIISHAIWTGLLSGLILLAGVYVLGFICVSIHTCILNRPAPPTIIKKHVMVYHNNAGVYVYGRDQNSLREIFGDEETTYKREGSWGPSAHMNQAKCYDDLSRAGYVHDRDTTWYHTNQTPRVGISIYCCEQEEREEEAVEGEDIQ